MSGRPPGVRSYRRTAKRSANALAEARAPAAGRTLAVVRTLAVAAIVGVGLVGCGGGSGSSSTTSTAAKTTSTLPAPAPPPNAEAGTVFVSLGNAAGLGQILVDSEGRTLYAFSADRGETPTCAGACAKAWPPLLDEHGEPQPSNGTGAARLGTVARADGSRQVTYAGHPLYTFGGDQRPGEANGNGQSAFGGTWTALKGNGTAAK